MNRARLLLIGSIALAIGAFASLVVYRNLKASSTADNRPGVNVVVAATDLQVGEKIADRDVKLVRFPEGDIPPQTFHAPSQVVGRGVILPMSQGEFILPAKLAGENSGYGLPSLIPPGMRAVSVRVNEVVSVAGFVVPGTRVDVLLTGAPGGAAEQQTTTVLENVAVIATGQKLERNAGGDPVNAPVITLLVSPDDAQKLTLASTQGRIQLTLRNPLDTRQQDLGAVNAANLYRGVSAPAPSVAAPKIRHHVATAPPVAAPPQPSVYSVEVIQGSKRETVTPKD
jgi:pilus assembly protein CpaB